MSGEFPCSFVGKLCALLAVAVLAISAWAADTEKVIYSFTGGLDGSNPASQLIFDKVGNAYGTTVTGGAYDCGTVFELTPMSGGKWQQSVLYSFSCFGDGKNPYGGVTFDGSGNLYGTTVAGGSGGDCTGDGCGVVYKLTQSGGGWSQSVLYNFTGGDDGFGPGGGVVFDKAGNLYGTTPDGGAYSEGVVYQLAPNNGQWKQTVIHAFTGGTDGAIGSLGLLRLDAAGNLYGVTELGGDYGAGVVYKLSSAGGMWKQSTLYQFQGLPDAGFPYGGLIADAAGRMYGTTYFGGTSGQGAIFELGPGPTALAGWKESVLYSMQGGTDASFPTSTLVFDNAGNLYGTSSTGGNPSCDCGTIFKLTPGAGGWSESVLHSFGSNGDGSYPYYGMTPDGMGNYFGTTAAGGAHGSGVIFEITP